MKNQNLETSQKGGKWKKRFGLAIPLLMLVGGIYMLSLVFAPKLVPYLNSGDVKRVIDSSTPQEGNDRLYVQKLGVNAPIKTGDAPVMNNGGVWHRFPERGDPVAGGNFILSAHRWHTGKTPAETIAQSPFYNMDRMAVGDSIFVDFRGKRYKYEIYEIQQVKPDKTQIEEPLAEGEEAHMTLYTCTLKGSADGRVVIYAKLAKL
jgi:sortase A